MRKIILAGMAITALAITPVWAGDDDDDDHDHDHKRQKHFEIEEPDGWKEALKVVEEKGAEMKAAYAAKDYNKMHELSYHLEVAADVLEEEAEELMEAVEEVHHATEDGETDKVDEKFPELEDRLNEMVRK